MILLRQLCRIDAPKGGELDHIIFIGESAATNLCLRLLPREPGCNKSLLLRALLLRNGKYLIVRIR